MLHMLHWHRCALLHPHVKLDFNSVQFLLMPLCECLCVNDLMYAVVGTIIVSMLDNDVLNFAVEWFVTELRCCTTNTQDKFAF